MQTQTLLQLARAVQTHSIKPGTMDLVAGVPRVRLVTLMDYPIRQFLQGLRIGIKEVTTQQLATVTGSPTAVTQTGFYQVKMS
jgi:hypothetical protein